jgi:D-alanyl-D-alanine carboxypeptidase
MVMVDGGAGLHIESWTTRKFRCKAPPPFAIASLAAALATWGCGSNGDETAVGPSEREPPNEEPHRQHAANPALPDAAALQQALDVLTTADGAPGALVDVRAGTQALTLVSGSAIAGGDQPMVGEDGRYRAGSITKSFTAVAVLTLAESGALELDDAIETHLPGIVIGSGEGAAIDGREISIRELLQHTSGLPNYTDYIESIPDEPVAVEDQIALALAHEPSFAPPGSSWRYTNTGYLVLGMLIERVSGQRLPAVLDERIFAPAGLVDTYWPEPRERALRGPHAHNYTPAPDGALMDVTELEPTIAGAAGQLVSTPRDLNRFWQALFAGELIGAQTLEAMLTTVPLPERFGTEAGYGLGVYRLPLSCGGFYWGHGGDHLGVQTLAGRAESGPSATVYITRRQGDETSEHLRVVLDVALCSGG